MTDWLWLMSVGNTDVQFPLYKDGSVVSRVELVRRGPASVQSVREQHQALHDLAIAGGLSYPIHERLPARLRQDQAMPDGLYFDRASDGAVIACELVQASHLGYRLHAERERLEFPANHLDVLCPKVEPLLGLLRETLAKAKLDPSKGAVVVLNTCRANDPREPLASGPVVSQFIAKRLDLHWNPGCEQGESPAPGQAGWIDILRGDETYESHEQQIVERVMAALSGLARKHGGPARVYVTPSGGFPKLKPLYPILAARRFGRQYVHVLEEPEVEGKFRPACLLLGSSEIEQQTLRLQAVEQIDFGNWLAAYGIAGAALATRECTEWAVTLQGLVAAIYDLQKPKAAPSLHLTEFQRHVLRIEAELAQGNVPQAVLMIGAFIETMVRDAAVAQLRKTKLGRIVFHDNGISFRAHSIDDARTLRTAFAESLLPLEGNVNFKLMITARSLIPWAQKHQDVALLAVAEAYAARTQIQGKKLQLAEFRNKIAHGHATSDDIEIARRRFSEKGLISPTTGKFGTNFIALKLMQPLLKRPSLAAITEFVRKINRFDRDLRENG